MRRLDVDVAIIGGGTAGCAAAVHLRRAGLTVALLERDRCGSGASGVNFGGVRQQGRNPVELPLARRAREIWGTINTLIEADAEFVASGHLKLARSEIDMAGLEDYARTARGYGLDLQIIGANRVREQYPWLGPAVIGASLSLRDGQANPRVVAPAYARLARKLGAEILEHTLVTSAHKTGHGFEIEAPGLTITCRRLLNTAGMGSAKIAAHFGETLPLTAMMPNMIVSEPMPFIAPQSIGVCGGDVYIRQITRGNVIFGGGRGAGDADAWRSRPKTDTTLPAISRMLGIIPGFVHAHMIRSWSGIDAETPDALPVIGPSATTPGLLHATGYSGSGFQLGPVIGEILAELVATGTTSKPITPFAANRFVANPPATDNIHRFGG